VENVQKDAAEHVLGMIKIQLPEEERLILEQTLTEQNIEEVLKLLPNGKATGIDGLPYEFWKWLNEKSKSITEDEQKNTPFNLIQCLTSVYNDIETNGVAQTTNFAEGWMCPLHKGKDRRDIANYRPITLLNSDYKIFTKALALKLARTAPLVIHENQAGFLPGRSITDQIRLTQMIINYAEVEEKEGAIIALDQEKAYDKIAHNYLWDVLNRFNFPPLFTNTVKSLYSNAETAVMINGELSSKYRVTRGVRQGDPLSCLLFDLAIEPLAEMLRQSNLVGFKAPGMAYRTVVTMFADDTTVYLTKDDNFETLQNILDAKFNTSKTEIIPVGPKTYWQKLRETKKLNEHCSTTLPPGPKVAKDGQAIRILGAWIGNETDEQAIWSPIIEKIEKSLKRWERVHPTVEGRKIIIQRTIGSMTQYLTVAKGMPNEIMRLLTAMSRSFIWDNEGKVPISLDILNRPIEKGGKNLLNLEHRNEAIELMWLKGLLAPAHSRPTWALFAHALLHQEKAYMS
jgi:hypothetical protein